MLFRSHKAYFAGLFDALGRVLVIRPDEMMIELRPGESLSRTVLTLDETIVLLALRATFEQAVLTLNQELVQKGFTRVYPDALLVNINEPEGDSSSGNPAVFSLTFACGTMTSGAHWNV